MVSNRKTSGNEELDFLNLSSSGRQTGRASLLLPSIGNPKFMVLVRDDATPAYRTSGTQNTMLAVNSLMSTWGQQCSLYSRPMLEGRSHCWIKVLYVQVNWETHKCVFLIVHQLREGDINPLYLPLYSVMVLWRRYDSMVFNQETVMELSMMYQTLGTRGGVTIIKKKKKELTLLNTIFVK